MMMMMTTGTILRIHDFNTGRIVVLYVENNVYFCLPQFVLVSASIMSSDSFAFSLVT